VSSLSFPGEELRPPEALAVPRAKRPGHWLVTAVALLLLALIIRALVDNSRFEWGTVGHYFASSAVLDGLERTIYLTAIAMAIGVTLGTLVALMSVSKNLVIFTLGRSYVWLFRGTPELVQIIFWFNLAALYPRIGLGLPFGSSALSTNTNAAISPLVAAILALGLNEAAYMAEVVRGGIISIPKGQIEAANSLGLSRTLMLRKIILPQAMKAIIPPTGNRAITVLKASSLVSVISLPELLGATETIAARTFLTIPLLIVASIWYLIITTVMMVGQTYLEKRYRRG